MRWDLFCRVIDNHGDVGVCWRLAADLAARGHAVRLWIDDARALAWMAPQGAPGVQVGGFDAAVEPGDVVVEAFGCDPPPAFAAALTPASIWLNLEYLSAESWVERCHALPSPQPGGMTKWFFYPGFTAATGGLLREPGLLAARERFVQQGRGPWLQALGAAPAPGERVVTLFCYDNPALPALLKALADAPTLLLLTPGPAQAQVLAPAQAQALPPGVRCHALPWLPQPDFDRLLWSSDLNFVRGEDSLVRAVWAAAPFVWQIYPQHDGVHAAKLDALLRRLPPVAGLAPLWRAWNGLAPWPAALPAAGPWRLACEAFCATLATQDDLATQLLRFVAAKARARVAGC